ncbi:MAG: type IV secretion system protein, partial [Candidatus Omnitrophica bacterium]|nr:type IV secretion system protein [Candidatus Omnitrophota bacterium]
PLPFAQIEFNANTVAPSPGAAGAITGSNITAVSTVAAGSINNNDTSCGLGTFIFHPIQCTLLAILKLMGILLSLTATLFNWIIAPANVKAIIDNSAIYGAWALVRDTLNIAFIMVLLFSAFATIFRVDKYNYKKILLTLVIMALLVNFSYPITRFIIDLSNVLMYYFVNALHIGDSASGSVFASIAKDAELQNIINPSNGYKADTTFLIAAIIFTFILVITLITVAIMFVIRTVALALLIIFSPIAFTGSIIPFLSGKTGAWWDNLFKYAFFGPIMVFMLYIAMEMMGAIGTKGMGSMQAIAGNQSLNPNFIAALSFFIIPVIILWFGLGFAQSMSIAGASAVTGRAKKFMGWSAKTLTGYRLGKAIGGAGTHWLNRKLAETKGLRYLSPMAMKDAWKRRTERSDRKALSISSGNIQNTLNAIIDRAASLNPFIAGHRLYKGAKAGGFKGAFKNLIQPLDRDRTDYNHMELMRFANEERKRLGETTENSNHIIHEYDLAVERGEPTDAGTVVAAQMTLAKNNDINDRQTKRGKTTIPHEAKLDFAADLYKTGVKKTENISKYLFASGENANQAYGFAYGATARYIGKGEIDERGKDTDGYITYKDIRTTGDLLQFYDLKTGKIDKEKKILNKTFGEEYAPGFYLTTEEEQAEAGAAKFSNAEPQTRQRLGHPDNYYEIDSNGEVKDIHLGGLKTFGKIHGGDTENAGRARDSIQRH